MVKNPLAVQEPQETWFPTLGWEDPLRRAWQRTSVFLPGESMNGRVWQVIDHRVAKSQTRLCAHNIRWDIGKKRERTVTIINKYPFVISVNLSLLFFCQIMLFCIFLIGFPMAE